MEKTFKQGDAVLILIDDASVPGTVYRVGKENAAVIVKTDSGQLRTVMADKVTMKTPAPEKAEQKAHPAMVKADPKNKAIEALPDDLKKKVTVAAKVKEIGTEVHEAMLEGKKPKTKEAKAIVEKVKPVIDAKQTQGQTPKPVEDLMKQADDLAKDSQAALDALKGKKLETAPEPEKEKRKRVAKSDQALRDGKIKEAFTLGLRTVDIAETFGMKRRRVSQLRSQFIKDGAIFPDTKE